MLKKKVNILSISALLIINCLLLIISCANSREAVEYYEIGMAYFELGKYDEAEKWLNRAKNADRTMSASQYNLGRIAYEQQRYGDASKHFEDVLKKDKDNVLALRAAAFSRIKAGDLAAAEKHYSRLFELVPDHADDGYNRALVLFALKRNAEAEAALERFPDALLENNDAILLYARILADENKPEAMDYYSARLNNGGNPEIRFEYAMFLEKNEVYARALEEYRKALSELPSGTAISVKGKYSLAISRTLLIADPANAEGIAGVQNAVDEGYKDIAALEELANNPKISAANRDRIRNIINNLNN